MASKSGHVTHLMVVGLLLAGTTGLFSTCGRVSFYDQGLSGDAGLTPRDAGGSASSSSSSTSTSSSSSNSGGCGPGPLPTFTVLPADVTQDFKSGWNVRGCNACHTGNPAPVFTFAPPMPDPSVPANLNDVATSLTRYCTSADNLPLQNLGPDAGYERLRLICTVLQPIPPPGDPCVHGVGTPGNSEPLSAWVAFANSCEPALARYRDQYNIWLDGGFAPDCGSSGSSSSGSSSSSSSSSSSGGVPQCPPPRPSPAWNVVWDKVGGTQFTCTGCHASTGISPAKDCYALNDEGSSETKLCEYMRQADGTLSPNAFNTTKLALSTLVGQDRYACGGTTTNHATFYAGGLDGDIQAWYNTIFP